MTSFVLLSFENLIQVSNNNLTRTYYTLLLTSDDDSSINTKWLHWHHFDLLYFERFESFET